jgi:hypothetical protein
MLLFRYQVMKDGVLLHGKPKDFYSYKIYAFRDYIDSRDLLRLKRTLIDKITTVASLLRNDRSVSWLLTAC